MPVDRGYDLQRKHLTSTPDQSRLHSVFKLVLSNKTHRLGVKKKKKGKRAMHTLEKTQG